MVMAEQTEKRGRGNPNWHKGQSSPNPGGRPRTRMVRRLLMQELVKPAGVRNGGGTNYERLIRRLLRIVWMGKDSDALRAIEKIIEITEGKPATSHDVEMRQLATVYAHASSLDPDALYRRALQIAEMRVRTVEVMPSEVRTAPPIPPRGYQD